MQKNMEEINHQKMEQRGIERFVIMSFGIYAVGIFLIALNSKWEISVSILALGCYFVAWIMYFGKYADVRFRSIFTTIMMHIMINLYATQVEDFNVILTVFITLMILAALYGRKEVIYISFLSTCFLFIMRICTRYSLEDFIWVKIKNIVFPFINICFSEFLLDTWIRKRMQSSKRLGETIKELKEAEQCKDDFLANVSHEIRTPINSICGISDIILHEEDADKMKEDIYAIQNAGESLAFIVNDILDFSELQSGKLELAEETYNITSTINDVINTVRAKKADKAIEVIVHCDTEIPCGLLGDEKKIRRIILSLLDNAIKFTQEGCISISISQRKEAYGINLLISITDTGIGIKEESLEKMYGSFQQVDSNRNRLKGGIGLGIAISQALVQKMGGIITVKSKFGKGSSFKVVVPQKVVDPRPIIQLENSEKINAVIYIDMEQFFMMTVRDEYNRNIAQMAKQLHVKCQTCRNLAELKRRVEREQFTHVFFSMVEYREDQHFFDELSIRMRAAIIIDQGDEKYISNPNIIKLYKPFYVLPIVSVLRGEKVEEPGKTRGRLERFIAPRVHVLVVDDNITNLRVIEGLLERYQIKVSTATSGTEALKKVEEKKYDFVFMDHMMPEMDGIETLHHIREKVGIYYQKLPVIALTANAVAGMRNMFLAEGFADFVAKPIEISMLERALKRNIAEEKIIYIEPEIVWDASEAGDSAKQEVLVGDLDTEKGILYCGGAEKYAEILKLHYREAPANRKMIQKLYDEKNWKDYIIAVHGLKSAMLSIGALKLSEMAKQLEFAGKENRISYIFEHHDAMMEEYERVYRILQEYHTEEQTSRDEVKEEMPETYAENEDDLPVLKEEIYTRFAHAFEEAMFELDKEAMEDIIIQMKGYQCRGTNLKCILQSVMEKVQMEDYMSASEELWEVKDSFLQKGDENLAEKVE